MRDKGPPPGTTEERLKSFAATLERRQMRWVKYRAAVLSGRLAREQLAAFEAN